MGIAETVTSLIAPLLDGLGVELVDVEHRGVVVRVVVDEPGGGISLERISDATHAVSRALDEADPISARYTLEVSSPGVERPLRTPRHFRAVVGQKITFKWSDDGRTTRVSGELLAADDEGVSVRLDPARPGDEAQTRRIAYRDVDRARTVFEWGPAPKPGKGSKPGAAKSTARQSNAKASGAGASSRSESSGGAADTIPAERSAADAAPMTELTTAGETP